MNMRRTDKRKGLGWEQQIREEVRGLLYTGPLALDLLSLRATRWLLLCCCKEDDFTWEIYFLLSGNKVILIQNSRYARVAYFGVACSTSSLCNLTLKFLEVRALV